MVEIDDDDDIDEVEAEAKRAIGGGGGRRVPKAVGVVVLVLLAIGAGAALFVRPPIPQDPAYHHFADARTMGRIPHALNVLSNLAFAIVGWLGLAFIARGPSRDPDAPVNALMQKHAFQIGEYAFTSLPASKDDLFEPKSEPAPAATPDNSSTP